MLTLDKRIKVNSLLLAGTIAQTNICSILYAVIPIPFLSVLWMFEILISIVIINRHNLVIKKKLLATSILLLCFLVVSVMINGIGVAGERILYFMTFGITAMIVVNMDFEIKAVIKTLFFIYSFYIIGYFLFQRAAFLSADDYWERQMGVAYGFLSPIIISFICLLDKRLLFNRDKLARYGKIVSVAIIIILVSSIIVVLFDCGTRGALLAAAIAMTLLVIKKLSYQQKITLGILLLIALVVVYISWTSLVSISLQSFSGSEIKALAKLSFMAESGDISNGREDIVMLAMKMIEENPFLGWGVGYFENHTMGAYVHQFFLESLLQWGLLGTVIFLIPIIKLIKVTRNEISPLRYAFNIFLLTIGFIPLMVSSSFWLHPPFWVCFFYAIRIPFKQYSHNTGKSILRTSAFIS